jgi:hypothetical protein
MENELGFGMQPMGIAAFAPPEQQVPDMRDVIGTAITNMAKQKAIDVAASKLGLPALGKAFGLSSTLTGPLGFGFLGPAGLGIGALTGFNNRLQTSTFGRSKTIADYLQAKRTEKAIRREQTRDLQDRINKGQFGTVTTRDAYRGGQYSGGDGRGGSGGNASTGSSAERGAALHG